MLLVSKAATPKPGPGPKDPVPAERAVGQSIYRTLKDVVRSVPDDVLATADVTRISAAIDWEDVGKELMALAGPLEDVITAAARKEIPKTQLAKAALPVDDEPFPIEFALINQLAVQFAAQHSGSLVLEISTKMRETITTVITGAVAGTLPRHAMIALLRMVLPLHSAWAETVDRVFADEYVGLLEEGAKPEVALRRAQKVAAVRAENLLQARVRNIARTEVMRAMNEGKFTGWSQRVADGWMPTTSLKEWVEGRSPCKQCAPLVGEIRLWDEPFSNGQMMPPEHPSCRCTAALLPPDEKYVRMREAQLAA